MAATESIQSLKDRIDDLEFIGRYLDSARLALLAALGRAGLRVHYGDPSAPMCRMDKPTPFMATSWDIHEVTCKRCLHALPTNSRRRT